MNNDVEKKTPKRRDPYALPAKMRKAARFTDRKKEKDKKKCRKKPSVDE